MGTGKLKMRVLHRNMLFPLAMDTQWEGKSPMEISSPTEDSENDMSWLRKKMLAILDQLQEAKPGSYTM